MKIPQMTKAQLEKFLNEELLETDKPNVFITKDGLKVLHKSVVMVQGNTNKHWYGNRPWQLGDQVKFIFETTRSYKEARQVIKDSRKLEPAMDAYKKAVVERGKASTTHYIDLFTGKLYK